MNLSIQENNKFYDSFSKDYDSRYAGAIGDYHKFLEMDVIRPMLDVKNKIILDIGTGTGRLVFAFGKEASEIIGIDTSEKMIEIAKGKSKNIVNVKFLLMDANNLKFPPSYFDLVTAVGSLEFIDELPNLFEEINRVLRQGGKFIFTYFNNDSLFHCLPRRESLKSNSLAELKAILQKNGFCLKEYKTSFFIPFQLVWKTYSFLKISWLRNSWIKFIIILESAFLKVSFWKNKGMQFTILCEKVKA